MCTFSYLREPDALTLFFNRDEKHPRAREEAPDIRDDRDLRILAPRDPDRGGTWLGVNEAGLVVAVLSHHDATAADALGEPNKSRGTLVLDLLGCRSVGDASIRLQNQAGRNYHPFVCAILSLNGADVCYRLDASGTLNSVPFNGIPPLTTSSFSPENVKAHRMRTFRNMVDEEHPDESALFAYHASYDLENGAASVLMRRPDAETRSIIRLRLTRTTAVMRYYRKIRGTFELEAPRESVLPLANA